MTSSLLRILATATRTRPRARRAPDTRSLRNGRGGYPALGWFSLRIVHRSGRTEWHNMTRTGRTHMPRIVVRDLQGSDLTDDSMRQRRSAYYG